MDVMEFVRRASTLPGQILSAATSGAVTKGTLQRGADADVVVLDPTAFADTATYESPTRLSAGVRHLLVAGETLIGDGRLNPDVRSGRAIRAVA
jgi:N-acyl-D-aspartate/D-glutamate deacylase